MSDLLSVHMAAVERVPLLSVEDERELVRRMVKGDTKARAQLIAANLRFVTSVAHKWKGYGIALSELVAEGNIGLVMAADRFKEKHDVRFCTYAVWWIKAKILDFVLREALPVRATTTKARQKVFFKLPAARRMLGENATPQELADALNDGDPSVLVTAEDVEAMIPVMAHGALSLDSNVFEHGGGSFADTFDDGSPSVDEVIGEAQESDRMRMKVDRALRSLSAKERYVIVNRLMVDEKVTLLEFGNRLKLSRERVRQIQREATKKLKKALRSESPPK